ncbi:hypothetical protein UY3_02216 [Chelonia mydas]|uniref:Myb/SANT-like DNA-binding domain-containing protein n=1 Tax=Chelonia mydas TaxID=8469 RepID=M7CHX7_CHEMY|nr:hypothetical protein UY3_02216 [Chelonia mydas]
MLCAIESEAAQGKLTNLDGTKMEQQVKAVEDKLRSEMSAELESERNNNCFWKKNQSSHSIFPAAHAFFLQQTHSCTEYTGAVGSAGSVGKGGCAVAASLQGRNFDAHEQIVSGLEEKGHERDTQQCHAKINELRQVYQKAREASHRSGVMPKTCCFYK